MRRFLSLLMLSLLLSLPVLAQDRAKAEVAPDLSGSLKLPHQTEAIWDVKFNYDLSVVTGGLGNAGAVFIPSLNQFWVSRWSTPAGRIYVVSTAGTIVDSFTTPGFTGARNMVFDGTDVVFATSTGTLYKVNPTTRAANGTIVLPAGVTARFITYNPDGNGGQGSYWVGNWNAGALNYFEVSKTGAQLSFIANTAITGTYGIAFDKWSTGGPYLWVWSQGAGQGTPQNIIQLSIATGQPTGVQHDVITDVGLGQTTAIAGGMFITDQLLPGILVMGGVLQGAPDRLFGYEIATLGPPPGPGYPTNPLPANNANNVPVNTHPYITWANPTGTVYNKVYFSTNLNEVNSFSPNALVLNGSPSTVHTTYNAVPNLAYNTDYFWRVIEAGATDSTTGPVWRFKTALAPAPNPPTQVAGTWTPQPNQTTVTWVNPTQNIFGDPITVDSSIIWRNDTRIGKVTGTGTQFIESNPPAGLHIYKVTSWAAGFGSAPGASAVVGVGLYSMTFSRNNLNLAIPDNNPTGIEDEIYVFGLTEANIIKVVVTIDTIIHTWDADLDITLVSPNGTLIDLSSDNGSSGDNYINCTLDDDATASVTTAVAPMTGIWKPETPLNVLANSNSWGSWKLRVVDDAGSDVGTLWAWKLQFITSEPIIPVEMTSFSAVGSNGDVVLNWSTATEVNNRGFEVERKAASGEFTKVGFIAGSGTVSETRSYTFTDKGVTAGKYTYRLRQVDFDGTFSYSNAVEVDLSLPSVFELGQNYPNPFNPATSIRFALPVSSQVTLKVFNTLGEEVSTLVNATMDAGVHNVNFSALGLNSGMYIYQIEAKGIDGQSFSSIKKMILTK